MNTINDPKNPTKPNDSAEFAGFADSVGSADSTVSEYLNDDMVAVSSDLTGLVQAPPKDEAQAESYAELHNVPTAEIAARKND